MASFQITTLDLNANNRLKIGGAQSQVWRREGYMHFLAKWFLVSP